MRVVDGGRHCASCDRKVHDFTRMTEREALARALLFGGSGLCGRLLVDGEGNTRFRPPVGSSRTRARVLPVFAAAAAFGAGCGATEPAAPPPRADAAQLPASQVAACEPAAKVVDQAPSVAASPPPGDDTADVPRRVIVTTSGDMRVLRQVTFARGESALDAEDAKLLEEVAKLMSANADIRKVLVKGHTDQLEPGADKLSRARADIVISFLVSRGVPAARLEPRGLGAAQPMADATTPEGRARNRRVEFQIADDP